MVIEIKGGSQDMAVMLLLIDTYGYMYFSKSLLNLSAQYTLFLNSYK